MDDVAIAPRERATSKIPWIVAIVCLVAYVATLNRWVTLSSLPVVAKVAGWDWAPQLNNPLLHLVTLPVKLLPVATQATALNLLSAFFAALSLWFLARSVSLLPHDRTRDQRFRERSEFSTLSHPMSWMPQVFAVLACGFQLTFWEHATAATGEMLDLACFSYCILCLLQHRLKHETKWTDRFALALGVSMANNWAMVGYFPAFLVAVIWIRGRSFLDWQFLSRTVAFGAIGLLLYLWLPLVSTLNHSTPSSFWDLLRIELGAQKNVLQVFPKSRVLFLSLTSLLPLVVIGIRWPSSFGDTSAAGAALTNFMFRLTHFMFLGACAWVTFDPKFSPRELGYGVPMLTFYYMGALSLGYFSGYFLLILSPSKDPKVARRTPPWARSLNALLLGVVWLGFLAVPTGLIYRNLPLIRTGDGSLLRNYAESLAAGIPDKNAVVLSDNSAQLQLLMGHLQSKGAAGSMVFIDTQSLPFAPYQKELAKRHPELLPKEWIAVLDASKEVIDQQTLLRVVLHISSTLPVHYLQPSFGGFFETFYLKPEGMAYRLEQYPPNSIAAPPIDPASAGRNLDFWKSIQPATSRLESALKMSQADAVTLGSWYSRSANFLGVELQRSGLLKEAASLFQQAYRWNSDNVAALLNSRTNERLLNGKVADVELTKADKELIKKYRTIDDLLAANGPLDEALSCFEVGTAYARGGLSRQAAVQFLRVQALDPANTAARIWLGNLYLTAPLPDKTLEIVAELRAMSARQALASADQIELIRLESLAHYGKGDTNKAERILMDARKQLPREDAFLDTLFYLYFGTGRFDRCLAMIEEQLKLDDKNIRAHINKGATYVEIKDYPKAIAALNEALKIQPGNANALRNRALAKLRNRDWDSAEKDYLELKKQAPDSHLVYFGLGEVAVQRNDKRTAIEHYEQFLRLAPPGGAEVRAIEQKLKDLKSKSGG